jgi:SAM-dependent methyltransferase
MSEYERWESRFSVSEYIFGTAPNAFLAAQRERLPKSGRALAIADGEGRNGVWLAEQGLEVVSLDFSPTAQEKARALAAERGVRITTELGDAVNWNYPSEAFDVVAIIFTQFCGPADRAKKFAGAKRALKPGGLLLLEGYTPKQLEYGTGGPKVVENTYTQAVLEEAFGDFTSLEFREYETFMQEGTAHGGMCAVIDLVGRK